MDYLEVLTKQSTFVLRQGVLYLVIPFFGVVSIASTCNPFFNPSFQNSLQVKNFLFISFLYYKDTKISGNCKENITYFSRKYNLFLYYNSPTYRINKRQIQNYICILFSKQNRNKSHKKTTKSKGGRNHAESKTELFCVLPWLHGYFSFLLMEEYKNTCILCILISLINKLILL